MQLGLILLGLVGFALGLLVLLVFVRMADERDFATRHKQKRIILLPEGTITRWSHG